MTDATVAADERIARLEERLARLEDEREIAQLLATYGPLVDSGAAQEVADIWVDAGIYDNDAVSMVGRSDIVAMVGSDNHQGFIAGGCAHVNGPAAITVTGDTAIAVNHSLMILHSDGSFRVNRATANHWELARTADGWRATKRTGRLLDGREIAPALLRAGALGHLAGA